MSIPGNEKRSSARGARALDHKILALYRLELLRPIILTHVHIRYLLLSIQEKYLLDRKEVWVFGGANHQTTVYSHVHGGKPMGYQMANVR